MQLCVTLTSVLHCPACCRRKADVQPEGWAMLREEYAGLVAEAREQAQRCVRAHTQGRRRGGWPPSAVWQRVGVL